MLAVAPNELDHFFQQHFPIVRAKCARMLGDSEEAADVAQETFLRFCGSPVVHEPVPARLRWIYLTGTRLAIDHLRRRRLGIEVPAFDGLDAPSAGNGAEQVVAARQALGRLAARMPAAELEVLVMTRFDRMSQEEVAEVIATSSRQVRRILVRAEQRLGELGEALE
jgi:RNA polymerase sigma-70 factor, ECF subfamily